MTATIYNGRGAPDAARTVSFALPAGDYSGLALTLDFLCNRIPAEIDGEGRCTATIPEEAVRAIPCGTHRATLVLRGQDGQEAVFASVPIRVSDIPGEASAYADVTATTPPFAPASAVTTPALAEALAAIDAPGTGATQRTLRETLAALVTALKSLSPAVALACLSLLGGAAAGEAMPWERVPPDTPVDPDALLPVDETDPVFAEWASGHLETDPDGYGNPSHAAMAGSLEPAFDIWDGRPAGVELLHAALTNATAAGTNYTDSVGALGRFALRRTLAETNSASWTVIPGDGVELLGDGRVVAFTNEYVEAGEGYAVRVFDIVPAAPRAGVPLDADIRYDSSAGSPDRGGGFPEEPEVGIVPTNGILRVEVAFRRGELRYRVSRCILSVRSLSFGPADMAEAARDDLTADDYWFRDDVGEASLGNLRQWATDEFAAKSAERWWQTTAGGGVSLGGNALSLGAGRFAQTLYADATNVLLTAGGQDALRVVDGYGLDADTNAEWRISDIRRTGTNVEVTVRCAMPGPWKSVALQASSDAAEWEETDFAPTIDGETWTYLVPTNTGYRFFKCAGSLVAHPESRVETDFSISALGDVTASNGLHRLSAKADASALAGYSPTGHVHALADISGIAAQPWVFTLTNGVAITNEVLVREVAQ